MDDLTAIAEFLKAIRHFHLVYRFTPKPDGGFENDAEHSWSVALTCMLLASKIEREQGMGIDHARMLKMALIHDLAEIITGDTKPWDSESRIGKEDKERVAIHDLFSILPLDLRAELTELWEACEARESLESLIVKSIDRLDPVIHRTAFEIGWRGSIEAGHATPEALDSRQLPRHSFSPTLTSLYELIRDEAISKGLFRA